MKSPAAWRSDLANLPPDSRLVVEPGRRGALTASWDGAALHSRYDPVSEANRFISDAALDLSRPVLLVGLGLGYHAIALEHAGFEVAAIENNRAIAKAAIDGSLAESALPIAIIEKDDFEADDDLTAIVSRRPQILVTPFMRRSEKAFAESVTQWASSISLGGQRLSIAVVGPMYGGSLPIAQSLARAFETMGHRTTYIDNSTAWPIYQEMTDTVANKRTQSQLGGILSNTLNEWSYARAVESNSDIVIVLAQAPVNESFARRLRAQGVVTAFWFVENWRHMSYWQNICRDYDTFMHIQPGPFEAQLVQSGCPDAIHIQTGCDPEIHRPVTLDAEESAAYSCEVSFAGAGYPNRQNVLKTLTDLDLKIWGVEWGAPELQPALQAKDKRFDGDTFSKICAASKICLNLHSSTTHHDIDLECEAINPRVFDIAACGGFQLCDAVPGLENYFDLETELPVYRTLAELRDRVRYYLDHESERAEIAQRARARAMAEHTYAHRAQQMLDHILAHHGEAIMRKGIWVQRTVAEVAADLEAESPLAIFLAKLPPDEPFSQETVHDYLRNAEDPPENESERIFSFLHTMHGMSKAVMEERNECAS